MEPNSHKKIQFAVPLFQSQIDPEAAEQIRKRRPTPASLVIMTESPSQNASPKQRKQSVYTPPAMKGTVQVLFLVMLMHGLIATAGFVPSLKEKNQGVVQQ
uniref:Protein phosphatase 1 regulatory inhibitor subunit 1C n=1 Tax=Sphenodon punctatus TaxID=8508 RepID=A0A8D0HIU8_SPHPU